MANELRVLTNFLGGLIEDDPLSATASILTSASLAAMPVIDATNHMALTLDPDALEGMPEIVYVTAHASGATTATILRGKEGTTALDHSKNIVWLHAATMRDLVHPHKQVRNVAGNVTLNSTNWADTGLGDITIPAWPGDDVRVGAAILLGTEAFDALFDVVTIVSAAAVNSVGAAGAAPGTNLTDGITAWVNDAAQHGRGFGPPVLYTVVAGDIVSGKVTFRLRYRSAGARTLLAQAGDPAFWWVENVGPTS